MWIQHLLNNPEARDDFLSFCEDASLEACKRALDSNGENLYYMKGKRDTYDLLISAIKQAGGEGNKPSDLEEILQRLTPQLFQR